MQQRDIRITIEERERDRERGRERDITQNNNFRRLRWGIPRAQHPNMGNKCVCVCACNLFTLLYTLLTILIHYSQTTFRNTQWYDRASIGNTIKFSTLFWAGKPRLESGITIVLLGPRGFSVLETSNKCPSHRHIEYPRKRRLKRVAVGQLICIRFFFLFSYTTIFH